MQMLSDRGYSESFKIHVVHEVELGNLTKCSASRKYNILGHSTVLKWCRKYGKLPQHTNSLINRIETGHMKSTNYETLLLQNELRALKSELKDSRLKNIFLETMIDIAEQEFKLPIRKKYGAKQCEK